MSLSDDEFDELFERARANVCPCYFFSMDRDAATEDELRAIMANSQAGHYWSQMYNPVDQAEFEEELRDCPDYPGSAA